MTIIIESFSGIEFEKCLGSIEEPKFRETFHSKNKKP
uniref:Uncharacterized protein n=1 Tax=Rhizophora mucronata TaxID=61149 RepID=A0A2P2QTP7_RHIMU